MNPSRHIVSEVQITPSIVNGVATNQDMYTLSLRYSPEGEWLRHTRVHIPSELLAFFQENLVERLYLETLPVNSPEQLALPQGPDSLVVGVEPKGEKPVFVLPKALREERRSRAIFFTVYAVAGSLLLANHYAWLGALAMVLAYHYYRTFRAMPKLLFSWFSTFAGNNNPAGYRPDGMPI